MAEFYELDIDIYNKLGFIHLKAQNQRLNMIISNRQGTTELCNGAYNENL